MKVCARCLEPDKQFWKCGRSKDGLTYQCTDCIKAERKRIAEEKAQGTFESQTGKSRLTPEERANRKLDAKEYNRQYRLINSDRLRVRKREYERRIKAEGLVAYGGKCSCCDENQDEFLTIEHLKGRDKSIKRLTGLKEWLRLHSLGWPREDITILCFNCNCGKAANGGVCPHNV